MRFATILCLTLAPLAAGCATASSKEVVSWGKSNVTYDQYRLDSVTCALAGVDRDISKKEELTKILNGVKEQDQALDRLHTAGSGGPDLYDTLREYNMAYERNIRGNIPAVQSYMVDGVHQCLRAKGYHEFRLTPEQASILSKLHKGTNERFHYLHQLASDPRNQQNVPDRAG